MYVLPIDNSYEGSDTDAAAITTITGTGAGSCASEELGTEGEVAAFSHFLGMSLVHAIS